MEKETLTPEEREMTKERILSDADLIKSGADIGDKGEIQISPQQYEMKMQEMEGPYVASKTIGGVEYDLRWDDENKVYELYFPGMPDTGDGSLDSTLRVGYDRKVAEIISQKIDELAKQGKDATYIRHYVEGYWDNIQETSDSTKSI